ncbi:MAG: 3-phosphoshikimate 1-carboxyvinyltransferase [Treponema sp.]|jgi:3-phosphoshikimate 1-carboxyvinyltransferase|nr:3-phosphoshikimate 1-carboxyvinyltransferase [Treponema sp.]
MLINPHVFGGCVRVPASKSHTIRRLLFAALGDGLSRIERPLDSLDARSCAEAVKALGARVTEERYENTLAAYLVEGNGRRGANSGAPRRIDAGNSGTTLFLALAAASLDSVPCTFTGDEQIARRSAGPLLDALAGLGVSVSSNGGCVPITVRGPWKGGRVSIECPTSQYLSALLLAAPLAGRGITTEIDVPLLNEKPYIEMTMAYLAAQGLCAANGAAANTAETAGGITYTPGYSHFRISGGASYRSQNGPVAGDFSSAAFPAAAALISGGELALTGLDPADTQGDKIFFEYLKTMGCNTGWEAPDTAEYAGENGPCRRLTVSRSGPLKGGVFDLNATPDMLPVMAVLAAYAEGETALVNAAHARIKETDRIACMAKELSRLGVDCEERPDGLVIHPGGKAGPRRRNVPCPAKTRGPVTVDGHGDHRIVMALACAALGAAGPVEILGAEAADVTYPGFFELIGARN